MEARTGSALEVRAHGEAVSLEEYLARKSVAAVDVKVCDLCGRWRHLTLPVGSFLDMVSSGVGVDASNYGLASTSRSDARLRFDLETLHEDTFAAVPTVGVIAQLADSAGEPLADDPRAVARRAEAYLVSSGIANRSLWLPELEWYVFRRVEFSLNTHAVAYRVEPCEEYVPGVRGTGYHWIPPADALYATRAEVTAQLERAGFPVKYHHHEVGMGQAEVELLPGPLVRMADAVMMTKYVARNVAGQLGLVACFLPKPLAGLPGSGMHVHVSLEKEGQHLFSGSGYAGLSDLALRFIGGLLLHAEALSALCNPSTNSYRRLVPGYEAPRTRTFGAQNRTAAIRIPGYASGRLEYRPLDATCNPYLAFAALLMAGLDGIRREVDPGREGFGPFEMDLDHPARAVRTLPGSLREALEALARDHDFLLEGGVFTASLLETWAAAKSDECAEIDRWPHPWEFAVYGDL